MQTAGQVTIALNLAFQEAGVGFRVQVHDGAEGQGMALQVGLSTLEEGKTAGFSPESSYALADFVGGFCRWLGTKGVTCSHTAQEVTGHFRPQATVLQALGVVQELCQMLDDKFGAYSYSILP